MLSPDLAATRIPRHDIRRLGRAESQRVRSKRGEEATEGATGLNTGDIRDTRQAVSG